MCLKRGFTVIMFLSFLVSAIFCLPTRASAANFLSSANFASLSNLASSFSAAVCAFFALTSALTSTFCFLTASASIFFCTLPSSNVVFFFFCSALSMSFCSCVSTHSGGSLSFNCIFLFLRVAVALHFTRSSSSCSLVETHFPSSFTSINRFETSALTLQFAIAVGVFFVFWAIFKLSVHYFLVHGSI